MQTETIQPTKSDSNPESTWTPLAPTPNDSPLITQLRNHFGDLYKGECVALCRHKSSGRFRVENDTETDALCKSPTGFVKGTEVVIYRNPGAGLLMALSEMYVQPSARYEGVAIQRTGIGDKALFEVTNHRGSRPQVKARWFGTEECEAGSTVLLIAYGPHADQRDFFAMAEWHAVGMERRGDL